MAHSSSEQPQKISLSELEQVLAQARDEGWSELALISRSLAGWANVLAQWSGSNAFAIDPLDTVAVTKLSSLTGLTSLGLIGHGIGAEGARALASLTSLTSLNLGTNGIGAEGARALLDAWVESPTAKRLLFLDLRENGDLSSVLPAEALDTTNAQAILTAYRRYRSAWNIQAVQPLNEAKLLLVGNEAVGKTSLIRYLIKNEPRNPSEPKTPGAAMHEQIDTQAWSPAVDGVTGQTQRDRPKGTDPKGTPRTRRP